MRRILLVLSFAVVMVAMVLATAVPAFTKTFNCEIPRDEFINCGGGSGSRGGGSGGHQATDQFVNPNPTFLVESGGGSIDADQDGVPDGGGGGRCTEGDPGVAPGPQSAGSQPPNCPNF